ncbi:hypothetical protein AGR7B_Cc270255 [Agrobacterium deltaense RV3]|nr:hypothetical protein AGR7B_Cc270255 [Agrobacterium deltaense RV3]
MWSGPGADRGVCLFERVDGARMFERQADIVQTVQHAMALEFVDLEGDRAAIGAADFLTFQIDGENGVRSARRIVQQLFEVLGTDDDRQDAILETVIVEDVGEAGGDHAADAKIEKRPWRMFARGAATEIVTGYENLGVLVGGLVQYEIRIGRTILKITRLGEEALAKAGALDGLQIVFRNDHVGVDIDHRHGRGNARQLGEFFHLSLPVFPFNKIRGWLKLTGRVLPGNTAKLITLEAQTRVLRYAARGALAFLPIRDDLRDR